MALAFGSGLRAKGRGEGRAWALGWEPDSSCGSLPARPARTATAAGQWARGSGPAARADWAPGWRGEAGPRLEVGVRDPAVVCAGLLAAAFARSLRGSAGGGSGAGDSYGSGSDRGGCGGISASTPARDGPPPSPRPSWTVSPPRGGGRSRPPPPPNPPPKRSLPSPPPPPLARSRDDADPLDPAPATPREEGVPLPRPPQPSAPLLSPSRGRFAERSAESGDRILGAKRRSWNKVRGSRSAGPGRGAPRASGEAGLAPGGTSLRPGARGQHAPAGWGSWAELALPGAQPAP